MQNSTAIEAILLYHSKFQSSWIVAQWWYSGLMMDFSFLFFFFFFLILYANWLINIQHYADSCMQKLYKTKSHHALLNYRPVLKIHGG